MYITKSKYVRGMQCPKMLWMDEHMPDEAISKAMPSILENGIKTGEVARSYFGEYSLVEFDPIAEVMRDETARLMNQGTENIAEATFVYEDLLCRVDILHFNGEGYDIVEVKSSTKIRDEYYFDISFQYYVLEQAGVKVDNVYLLYVNNQYIREGELDLNELFIKADVTYDAKALATAVKVNADSFISIMAMEAEPEHKIGICCENPFECDFKEYCTRFLPKPSVLDIAGLFKSKKYRYLDEGIVTFEDVLEKPFLLNMSQRKQVETEVNDAPDTVEKRRIQAFLDTLSYPMYHLDFETFQPAVPPFDYIKPWQQIPFQYSLHVQREKNGPLEHYEFLGEGGTDPRRALAEQLCEQIPLDVCSLAYNMKFEKMIIRQLADTYADLSVHLMNIHDNMRDLMIPFKEKSYYSRKLEGSYSIKYVLPAMCGEDPELDYTALNQIHNGSEAMDAFPKLGDGSMSEEEIAETRRNLLAYCRLDTLAMVKVLEKLQKLVEE